MGRAGFAAAQLADLRKNAKASCMTARDRILGVILAGGKSRRFGGGDKGMADLGGETVLAHVIARFRPQVGRLILSVNGDPQRFAPFNLTTIIDQENAELGPLSGILAALDWQNQHAHDCTALATVSTDVPFLPLDLVHRLDAERGGHIAVATSDGQRHPTIAMWPVSARAAVADALQQRQLSVNALTQRLNAVAVPFALGDIEGMALDPFLNVNTPDDLAAARAFIGKA
jgi:molybdopterin-guanine dinucleotide biosynthesis protein A